MRLGAERPPPSLSSARELILGLAPRPCERLLPIAAGRSRGTSRVALPRHGALLTYRLEELKAKGQLIVRGPHRPILVGAGASRAVPRELSQAVNTDAGAAAEGRSFRCAADLDKIVGDQTERLATLLHFGALYPIAEAALWSSADNQRAR